MSMIKNKTKQKHNPNMVLFSALWFAVISCKSSRRHFSSIALRLQKIKGKHTHLLRTNVNLNSVPGKNQGCAKQEIKPA